MLSCTVQMLRDSLATIYSAMLVQVVFWQRSGSYSVLFVLCIACVIVVIIVARRAILWVYAHFVHRQRHFNATTDGSNVQRLFEQISFDCPNNMTLSPSVAPHTPDRASISDPQSRQGWQGCDVSVQSSPMVRHVETCITYSPPL